MAIRGRRERVLLWVSGLIMAFGLLICVILGRGSAFGSNAGLLAGPIMFLGQLVVFPVLFTAGAIIARKLATPRQPHVSALYTCAQRSTPMVEQQSVFCMSEQGISGDRYCITGRFSPQTKNTGGGTYSNIGEKGRQLTIISADEVDKLGLDPADCRRNVVVSGLDKPLTSLLGWEIMLGGVRVRAHRETKPCDYLAKLTNHAGLEEDLWNCGGLSCEILSGGDLLVLDAVVPVEGSYQADYAQTYQGPPAEFLIRPKERTAQQRQTLLDYKAAKLKER